MFGARTNAALAAAFVDDLVDCHELTTQELARTSPLRRLGEASARLISPLL